MIRHVQIHPQALPVTKETSRADLATDSGMLCLWDSAAFAHVTDYDSWDKELCEDADIVRHIMAGHLVPLNLGDGAFAVDVRVGIPEHMTEREKTYWLVPSQPYYMRNSSGTLLLSAIEQIGNDPRSYLEVRLPAGDYCVRVQLIDWTQEPGATTEGGSAASHALPDMIVFVDSFRGEQHFHFRTELKTFRREDALR